MIKVNESVELGQNQLEKLSLKSISAAVQAKKVMIASKRNALQLSNNLTNIIKLDHKEHSKLQLQEVRKLRNIEGGKSKENKNELLQGSRIKRILDNQSKTRHHEIKENNPIKKVKSIKSSNFLLVKKEDEKSNKRKGLTKSNHSAPSVLRFELFTMDERHESNCLLCLEYIQDVYIYLKNLEQKIPLCPNFIAQGSEITARKRSILVDWLITVHSHFRLTPETLFLTVVTVDRFLQKEKLTDNYLQLVGITCTFIASKFEEIYPPNLTNFLSICDNLYRKKEILKMEMKILKAISYNLSLPLPIHFLRRFSKAVNADSKLHTLAKYFMELTLVEYDCAHWKPSLLAATSLYVALLIENKLPWSLTAYYYTQYSENALLPYVSKLCQVILKSRHCPFQSCRKKYSSRKLFETCKEVDGKIKYLSLLARSRQ